MKKYLFGLFAVALAIGSFAFTMPKSVKAQVVVAFVGDLDDQASVQDESLWEKVSVAPSCDGTNDKACMIQIDETRLTSGTPQKLNPQFVTVNAAIGGEAGFYRVTSLTNGSTSTPGTHTITNKN